MPYENERARNDREAMVAAFAGVGWTLSGARGPIRSRQMPDWRCEEECDDSDLPQVACGGSYL